MPLCWEIDVVGGTAVGAGDRAVGHILWLCFDVDAMFWRHDQTRSIFASTSGRGHRMDDCPAPGRLPDFLRRASVVCVALVQDHGCSDSISRPRRRFIGAGIVRGDVARGERCQIGTGDGDVAMSVETVARHPLFASERPPCVRFPAVEVEVKVLRFPRPCISFARS